MDNGYYVLILSHLNVFEKDVLWIENADKVDDRKKTHKAKHHTPKNTHDVTIRNTFTTCKHDETCAVLLMLCLCVSVCSHTVKVSQSV